MTALVVGVGEPWRGDDGVGPAVVARLDGWAPADVRLVSVATPVRLPDTWAGHDVVVVVDAVRSGHEPGAVTVVEVGTAPLPVRSGGGGTHGFGVGEAVELARATGTLPPRLVLVGVEATSFTLGTPPSAAVAAAVDTAATAVLATLGEATERYDPETARTAP